MLSRIMCASVSRFSFRFEMPSAGDSGRFRRCAILQFYTKRWRVGIGDAELLGDEGGWEHARHEKKTTKPGFAAARFFTKAESGDGSATGRVGSLRIAQSRQGGGGSLRRDCGARMEAAKREGSDTGAKKAWKSRARGVHMGRSAFRAADISAGAYRYGLSAGNRAENAVSHCERSSVGTGNLRHEGRLGAGAIRD